MTVSVGAATANGIHKNVRCIGEKVKGSEKKDGERGVLLVVVAGDREGVKKNRGGGRGGGGREGGVIRRVYHCV